MMEAGEQYIKSSLQTKVVAMPPDRRPGTQVAMIQ